MRQQGIFLKIHLSFWLTTILIIATQISIDRFMEYIHPMHHPIPRQLGASLAMFGEAALDRHMNGPPEGIRKTREMMRYMSGATVYLLDTDCRDIENRPVPQALRRLAEQSMANHRQEMLPEKSSVLLALTVPAPNGRTYIAAGEFPHPFPMLPPGKIFHLTKGLLVVLIISGIVCYFLARYLTAPIIAIQDATRRVASGEVGVRIAGMIGSRKDELSDLAGDFDHMTERIEQLMSAQRQLLGDISHELRSPLARLNVALELARRYTGPEANNALRRIEKEARLLNTLIGYVLTLTRLESDFGDIRMAPVSLPGLLQRIASDGDFEAQGNSRRVVLPECEPCTVLGNVELLRMAIENIVRNAIRHTAESTSVEIRLKQAAADGIVHAEITVRDRGSGVPEADLPHIFHPFYRVSDARERSTGGTGLGLAIADRAVHLHNGVLKAANAPDGGLIVTLLLPLDGSA